jgi:hypothetical protein
MYLSLMKWLWDPHVKRPKKNTMGMHRIVEEMGKTDLDNWVKIVTLEKC